MQKLADLVKNNQRRFFDYNGFDAEILVEELNLIPLDLAEIKTKDRAKKIEIFKDKLETIKGIVSDGIVAQFTGVKSPTGPLTERLHMLVDAVRIALLEINKVHVPTNEKCAVYINTLFVLDDMINEAKLDNVRSKAKQMEDLSKQIQLLEDGDKEVKERQVTVVDSSKRKEDIIYEDVDEEEDSDSDFEESEEEDEEEEESNSDIEDSEEEEENEQRTISNIRRILLRSTTTKQSDTKHSKS